MSSLTPIEKLQLERLLEMGGGYVLSFSNRTFAEFFVDTLKIDIWDEKYACDSGSKANRVRAFWKVEPDGIVAVLLQALIEYAQFENATPEHVEACFTIVERLQADEPLPDLEAIKPNREDPSFQKLAEAVHSDMREGNPEVGLDRLHAFVTRYLRELCTQEGIQAQKDKPLHSLLGELIKVLKANGRLESAMSERILKISISILDGFNDVRNNKSLAHPNELLSQHEAWLIFNSIANLIRFLDIVCARETAES